MKQTMPDVTSNQWSNADETRKAEGPDPIQYPDYYDGIMLKRVLAYIMDFVICGLIGLVGSVVASIAGIMSFGLLFGPMLAILALVPFIYYTLLIGSKDHATYGMRFVGIRVYQLNGQGPSMLQAFVQTAIFFLTVPATSFLILIVSLFNSRRRCLHDMLAGTIILNEIE